MRIDKPTRVARTYVQQLVAEPGRVLPLLCPVREADWIEGWDPLAVWTESGVAERDCVFITRGTPEAVWYVTQHDAQRGFVEMVRITPGMTACKLSIQLAPAPAGATATITYLHTSLGPEGDALVASFTEAHYATFMRDWEARINHYLTTGSALRV
jgi:hypothetical protein